MPNSRYANGHRRRQLRARVLREEDNCWLCGEPVNKELLTPHPGSPEVDEVVPVSLGGDPLARDNCRLSHRQPLQRATGQRDTTTHTARCQASPRMVRVGGTPLDGDTWRPPRHCASPISSVFSTKAG